MGAYLTTNPATCQVYLSSYPIQGGSQWYAGLPSVSGTTIFDWYGFSIQFPGYVSVPSHCIPAGGLVGKGTPTGTPPSQGDSPSEVPKSPITGEPPPPECGVGPGIIKPSDPSTGPITGGWMNGDGAPGATDGNSAFDTLAQPLVMGLTPLPTYSGEHPIYTQEPYFELRQGGEHAIVDVYHEGTGPGSVVFHPPELQDYHLFGITHNTPESRWPTNISASSVMLHNAERDDGSAGDVANTYLAFGVPLVGTSKPGRGHYFAVNPGLFELCLFTTDFTGADLDNGTFTLKEMAFNLGHQATAGLGLYSGATAGALIWNTTEAEVQYYNGTSWLPMVDPFGSSVAVFNPGPGDHQLDVGDSDVIRLEVGSFGISGLENGRPIVKIENTGAFNVNIKNQDGTADAPTRIITGTGIDYVLAPDCGALLYYDVTTQRWRLNVG